MSLRPIRSCRVPLLTPNLPEIVARISIINENLYQNIKNEFEYTYKYFKGDTNLIASFWFKNYEYNLLDTKQQFLIYYIISYVGLKHPLVVKLLENLDDTILYNIGACRVKRGNIHFYRLRNIII